MVERRVGCINRCSLGAASEASTYCRRYAANAVAPGRKWPCGDDRLRSAEFGYGGEDAAAERNLANGILVKFLHPIDLTFGLRLFGCGSSHVHDSFAKSH
jgi:hypothetical protein